MIRLLLTAAALAVPMTALAAKADKAKGPKPRVMICHYEEVDVTPEEDEATLELVGELKNLPIPAVMAHLRNHDDDTDMVDWALDADGDGLYDPTTVTAACEQPGDGFILLGEDSEPDDDDTPEEPEEPAAG